MAGRIRVFVACSLDGLIAGVDDDLSPARLYHGTYPGAVESIREQGMLKGQRHAVHMAADTTTASKVGMRRGAPVILTIRADQMVAAGHRFQVSANGVWLTEHVPPRFLDFPPPAR